MRLREIKFMRVPVWVFTRVPGGLFGIGDNLVQCLRHAKPVGIVARPQTRVA